MIEHPKSIEIHKFHKIGSILLLTLNELLLCQINELASDILDLSDGRQRKEIIDTLNSKYSETDIMTTLDELEEVGILVEEIKQPDIKVPVFYPIKNLEFNVCHDCNLKCLYCYGDEGTYHGPRTYMTKEVADSAIDFLMKQSGEVKVCGITFFGGEPLMNFPLIQYIVNSSRKKAEFHDKQIRFNITTNGTLLTDEIINYLNEEKINVLVSMDGPKEIQDKMRPHICSGISSYDSIAPKVQQFINSQRRGAAVRTTITSYCLNLPAIVDPLLELGFRDVYLSPVSVDTKESYALSRDDLQKLNEAFEKLERRFLTMAQQGKTQGLLHLRNQLIQFHRPHPTLYPCGAARAMMVVSAEGDLYPCHRFVGLEELRLGNVLTGWDDSFRKEVLSKPSVARKSCRSCWARYLCAGGCYAMNYVDTGDVFVPKAEMCHFIRNRLEIAMSIYAEAENNQLLDKIFPPRPPLAVHEAEGDNIPERSEP